MERRKKTWLWVIVVVVVLLAGAAGVWLVASGPEMSEKIAEPKEKPKEASEVTHTEREKLPKPGEDGEKKQEDKGEDAAKEEEAANVDVEQVKTVQLPEGTKDVMLDPETLEPKVLIGDTYIRFVDEELTVKNSVVMEDNNRFYLRRSDQGKYLGIYIGKFEPNKRKFLFMDIEGNLIWERKGFICSVSDGLAPCYVSDDGMTAAYTSTLVDGGIVSFYRKNWSKVLYPLGHDMYAEGNFSGNGNYFAVVIFSEPYAILYNSDGKEIWRRNIAGDELSGYVLISNHAKYVVVASSSNAYCLDSRGEIIWKLDNHYSNNNLEDGNADYISEDLNRLLLRKIGLKDISMIDVTDGSILWQKHTNDLVINYEALSEEDSNRIRIKNAHMSQDWNRIAIATWQGEGISPTLDSFPRYVNLFDQDGNFLWREAFSSNLIPFVSKDGSLLAAQTKESVYYYQIR
ncbi:MAG: hypothetical protein R6V10_05770 [bacterium]